MASPRLSGLGLLEARVPTPRAWRQALAILGLLGLSAIVYLAVQRSATIEQRPTLERLYQAHLLDEIAAALLVLAIGGITLAVLSARRISRAAAVANQQKAVLDRILASVPDALVVADASGLYRANAAAVSVFGLANENGGTSQLHAALQALDLRDAESGHRIPAEAGVLSAALAGRAAQMDVAVGAATGASAGHSLRVTGASIPFPDGGNGGLVLASDITERRANQEALEAARERLETQNAANLQMVRAVAHDLANALSPATIQLRLLQMKNNAEKRERSIAVLERSLAQMARLVRDLSDVAKIEARSLGLQPRPMPLRALAATTVEAFAPMAKEKGVALELVLGAGIDDATSIIADPERIGQVLTNLTNNALKFTPAGGRIELRVEMAGAAGLGSGPAATPGGPSGPMELTAGKGKRKKPPPKDVGVGGVRLSVTDSGAGLRADQIARLFQAFSQVHEPGSIPEKGSGLGLFICKGLIEGHGGEIGVTSPGPTLGSTFWFTLPAKAAEQPTQ